MRVLLTLVLSSFCLVSMADELRDFTSRQDLAPERVVSGTDFLTRETKALQDDDFANPGLLWVDRGKALFNDVPGSAPACGGCHQSGSNLDLATSATRYPRFDEAAGKALNLEQRINVCRVEQQQRQAFAYESEQLLALSAYLTNLAKGQAFDVAIDGPAADAFNLGRSYFFKRKGQLNLACNQCHDENWGKRLRGDRMSQGQPNAFPAYRIEWQTLGSLHRRLQDCDQGIRAEILPKGSETYVALELYLKWRAANLEIEAPGVRR